jgi:hypothetical protein
VTANIDAIEGGAEEGAVPQAVSQRTAAPTIRAESLHLMGDWLLHDIGSPICSGGYDEEYVEGPGKIRGLRP